jgi:tetratricopeptide (TPR) repeat protein
MSSASLSSPDPAPASPLRIARYEVQSVLGHGSMGVVYHARDVDDGRLVALKMAAHVNEQSLAALRREVHALTGLGHPGVVGILDEGIHDGLPWFAMELLEGRTFRDWLDDTWPARGVLRAAGGRLDELLALFVRICDPLARIHEHGVVHRDLKPENVFLRHDGTPVLVDFGLFARAGAIGGREVLDVPPGMAGTDAYMAPEQICGELVDARADLYALGCMLYEAVAGRPPFVGASTAEVLRRHLDEPPVALSERIAGVPAWLDELVLQLLRKSRRDRLGYADVAAARISFALGPAGVTVAPAREPLYLYRPEFVGRAEALAELEACIGAAVRGATRAIFVGGESGIGKTRLAMEAARIAADRGMSVVIGECSVVGEGARVAAGPLHPFRKLFALIADRCRTHGRKETDRILGARGPLLAPYEPAFADLPGQEQYPPPVAVSPEAALERLQEAVVWTVAALARAAGPLFLILDDLHWADELSLRAVAALGRMEAGDLPLLLVGTYRSEELEEDLRRIVEEAGVRTIELERLAPDGVRRMVGDMLAMADASPEFVARLVGDTEGNPFLVSEYLLVAVGEGVLDRDPTGRWRLQAGAQHRALSMPRSLQGLVRLRLARLSPAARRLAEIASVMGQAFDEGLLMHATPYAEPETMEAVQELVRRRMLERGDAGVLTFTHGKIREVTYEDILPDRRARDHEHVARSIERFYSGADLASRHAAALAYHWREAADAAPGDVERALKAIAWLERAGEQAARSYASHETLHLFGDALRVYGREEAGLRGRAAPRLERWERRLGEACFRLGRVPEAQEHLERALTLLGEPGRPSRARLLLGLAGQAGRQLWHRLAHGALVGRAGGAGRERALEAAAIYEQLGLILFINLDTLRASYTNLRALNLAETCGPSPALAGSSALAGLSVGLLFGSGAADHYFAQGKRSAETVGDRYGYGRVLYTRSLVLAGLGEWRDARGAADEARSIFVEIGDTRWRDTSAIGAGVLEHARGRYREALGLFEEAVASTRARGDVQASAWATIGYAAAALGLGDSEESLRALGEVEGLLGGRDFHLTDKGTEINFFAILVPALFRARAAHRAFAAAARAAEVIHQSAVMMFYTLAGYAGVAEVLLRLWERCGDAGEYGELPRLARRALRDLERFARLFPIAQPDAALLRGLYEWRRGRRVRAHAAWKRSVVSADRLAMVRPHGLALYEIGRHLPPDDPERAGYFERAAHLFTSGEMAWELGLVEEAARVSPPRR